MDKSIIRNYAVDARRKLIEAVKLKAQQLYIFEDSTKTLCPGTERDHLKSDGIFLSSEQLEARKQLYSELLHEDIPYKPAIYNRMIENIACTWFNRLIALRIMEVNDWLPSNIRILSSREQGRIEPDAVREAERLDYVNQAKVAELRADTDINAHEKLYKYILISQCNALSSIMPGIFEEANDYTELLLPDALLTKGGIVNDLVTLIHEDNFKVKKHDDINDKNSGQIEIVGWLYQFYISEKKDEVFAGLKKNIKINKDTIPAATQLFTPEWIVKYMVENSLGRLWLERHPNNELRAKWKYYIDEAEQEPEVAEHLRVLRSQSPVKRPEDIKLIDPCMGSGHILVYAFEVLFQIYQSEGYSEREIPNLILQNNLYGLDIDERAGQLAYFALMIKARSYNRRFFRQENVPQPMVSAIPKTKMYIIGLGKWLGASMSESEKKASLGDLKYLAELFSKGKEYGSAIKIEREIDFERLKRYIHDYALGQMTFDYTEFVQQAEHLDHLIDVAELLSQKYDVVVTNPPYMAPAPSQSDWIKKNYPDSKSDLCVVFIERNFALLKQSGYLAMITMHSWMFLSSFEKFRKKLIASKDIVNMAHLGARAFEEIGGEVVQTTAFVMRCSNVSDYFGTYVRLVDFSNQQAKKEIFLLGNNRHITKKDNFEKIPGWPVAYWVKDAYLIPFEKGELLRNIASPKQGSTLGDNATFMRFWFEVERENHKWFKCMKGGEYRKWYGNTLHLLDWENNGQRIKSTGRATIRSETWLFQKGVTWSNISSNNPSFRLMEEGFFFESTGSVCFIKNEYLLFLLAFLNTPMVAVFANIVNPTLHLQSGDVAKFPLLLIEDEFENVNDFVTENIRISRTDWDSFETSWDFKRHPLIHGVHNAIKPLERNILVHKMLESAFQFWQRECDERFQTLKANEEELNRIFIDIYGLQDELTPEVEDKDVTVRKADLNRDIRSFISYAVGCMFGRYSLDEDGLVFAGGKFDMLRYKSFMPASDNIIPIGSADYFDDDIVVRFIEFVRVVYGNNTLGENLSFIADALYPNGSGTAHEKIRRYFLNDFYKDHIKTYQKRPIYWLLDSGKKDGFKALFYLHRYDKYTVARARTDYLHPLQRKYEAEIKRLGMLSGSTGNAREKAAYRKEIDGLQAKIDECRIYDQVVSHIAHQQIELDLDDGVKVNYEKFQGVEVPMDNGKTVTMDLLGKI